MNTVKPIGVVGLAIAALFAGQAFATECAMRAPATGFHTYGGPVCIAQYGSDGPGTGLQAQLDAITQTGSTPIDVYNGQTHPDAYWSTSASGLGENRLMFEIAGNANFNSFGIFDPTDRSNQLQIFSGPSSAGAATTLMWNGAGNFSAFQLTGGTGGVLPATPTASAAFGNNNLFGYYLSTPVGTFYSDPHMNQPGGSAYPGGMPHMVSYAGNGQTWIDTNGTHGYAPFNPGEYILAWEDTPYASSDLDYNDFVVMVESVHAVPEPATLATFGFGTLLLGGLVMLRRRSLQA